MNRTQKLGTAPVGKLLVSFAIPAITGMLIQALYGVTAAVFIGRGVSAAALTGIAVSIPVTMMIIGFAMLSGLGATSIVSLYIGEGRNKDAEKILGNALTTTVFIGILVSIAGTVFLRPVLFLFGANAQSMPYAEIYAGIFMYGAAFQSVAFSLNAIIRGEGNPKVALSTISIGFGVYIITASVLIFFFKIGIAGAAIGAVFSQLFTSTWVVLYFCSKRSVLKLHRYNLIPDFRVIKKSVFDRNRTLCFTDCRKFSYCVFKPPAWILRRQQCNCRNGNCIQYLQPGNDAYFRHQPGHAADNRI